MSKIFAYLNEQNGASAAEFALVISIMGVAVGVAANFLGVTPTEVAACIRAHTDAARC